MPTSIGEIYKSFFAPKAPESEPLLPSAQPPRFQSTRASPHATLGRLPSSASIPERRTDETRLTATDSQVSALFAKHITQHLNYRDADVQLLRRTLKKVVWGSGRIALEAIAGLGLTYATAVTTKTFLGIFAGEDRNSLQAAVIDASVYLANTRSGAAPAAISERTALGLMTLSVAIQYPMAMAAPSAGNNQGAQYAVASMFVARLTKAMDDVFLLLKNMRPTKREDVREVFNEFYATNKTSISNMDYDRRQVYNLVEGELKQYWRPANIASDIGTDQLTNCRYLLETLEILVKSSESAREAPKNNWYYDIGDVSAAEELNKRIARLCEGVDDAGKKAVEKFAINHLLRRSANWAPMEDNRGAPNMNVLVLAGEPGSGKSFISKTLCTELESEEVTVIFSDVLRHLGGDDKKDQLSEGPGGATVDPSPSRQFGTFRKLLCVKPGSIIRMEEVNLITKGKNSGLEGMNFVPIDYDYLNSIKMKWEPNDRFGVFSVKGYPEGVLFFADLRRVSFIMTTNNVPNDPALHRRMGVAYCNRMPEPKRREIALNSVQFCFSNVIPRFYQKSLSAQQIYAIKMDLARMMEFIVSEGKKDAGPQIMQMVIMGLSHDLARQYAHGKRTANTVDMTEPNHLDNPTMTAYGQTWGESALDAEEERSIIDHFKANRGLDSIDNLLKKVKADLANSKESDSLPDAQYYMDMAKGDNQLSPKDVMKFTIMAVSQQWEPYLDKRPADIQKSVEALRKEALSYATYIKDGEDSLHHWRFEDAKTFVELFDSIMRIPSAPKNLSHWEVGGNQERRKEMLEIRDRIQSRFVGGRNSGQNIVNFVQRTIDNTFPVTEDLREGAQQRCVLSLSGPLGTNPTEEAKKIIEDMGLNPIVMSLSQYLGLYETGQSRGAGMRGEDNERIKLNLETIVGQFKSLLQGKNYNCAIVIADADFGDPSVAVRARQHLGPNAKNPKIAFDQVRNVEFEIPVNGLSVIVTTEQEIDDPALKLLMWEERIEKISESDRRKTLQSVFANELTKLDQFDIATSEKENIRNSVGKMVPFCLERNVEGDPGPEPAVRAVRKLFETLRVRAQDAAVAAGVKGKGRAVADEGPSLSSGFELSWEPFVREDLPPDLVEVVEGELRRFRAIQGGAPEAVAKEAPEPPANKPPAERDTAATSVQRSSADGSPVGNPELFDVAEKLAGLSVREIVAVLEASLQASSPSATGDGEAETT